MKHQPNLQKRVVLVRHGETEWSKAWLHTGRTDIPLTENGERQARKLRKLLAHRKFELVLSSPLSRALLTARLAGFGKQLKGCPDLCEWNYGDYEGKSSAEIKESRPDWNLWRDGPLAGESLAEVADRADRVIDRIDQTDGDVLLFGHGHQLRILTARWLGQDPSDARLYALTTGTVSELGYEHDWRVLWVWNQIPG